MSISTDVTVECQLPDGGAGGAFITFDAGLMFQELRLAEDGRLWLGRDNSGTGPEPFPYDGVMRLQGDGRDYAALFADGMLIAIRPGYSEAWAPEARSPSGPMVPIAVSLRLHGMAATPTAPVQMLACGLPVATDDTWTLGYDGLCAGQSEEVAQSIHGWVFLSDPAGALPHQAVRLVAGRVQWLVTVSEDGTARVPHTLAEIGPSRDDEPRQSALMAACAVLPTDYTDYGGDVLRWASDDEAYPDCSCGCRWFNPLWTPEHGGHADGDWGVCANPKSPRCGCLTWEHQAGLKCWQGDDESGRT